MPGWEGAALQIAGPILGSLLGGGMSKEQKRAYRMTQDIANRFYRQGVGVPGSDPQEQAALAQQQALLGEQQLGQQRQALSALNLNQGTGNLGDFLANLSSQQTAQRMNVSSEHFFNALSQRKQSLLQAANLAGQAAQLAQVRQPGSDIGQYLGQIGEAMSYQEALKRQRAATQGVTGDRIGRQIGATPAASTTSTPLGPPDITNPSPGVSEWASRYQNMLGGMVAAGNEPGGANGVSNQMRQGLGLGRPIVPLGEQIRQYVGQSGLRFG